MLCYGGHMLDKPIDTGKTIVIENDADILTAARYLQALAEGNEYYRPAGLKLKQKDML